MSESLRLYCSPQMRLLFRASTSSALIERLSPRCVTLPNRIARTPNSRPTVCGPNPIDNTNFFVRQQYLDFLGREPDSSGLAFWTNEITSCGSDQACILLKRINVSAAFFLSVEFQQTGYLVYKANQAAFNSGEFLKLRDFLTDTQEIGRA
jgi:Domain of unknown function (DUF4214)